MTSPAAMLAHATPLLVNAHGIPLFNDPRFQEAESDRSDPPFYRYREYGHYEYEIVGRDGSHYTAQYSNYFESLDLFDHNAKRFLFEEGLKDIDEVIDVLNERRWRAGACEKTDGYRLE